MCLQEYLRCTDMVFGLKIACTAIDACLMMLASMSMADADGVSRRVGYIINFIFLLNIITLWLIQ